MAKIDEGHTADDFAEYLDDPSNAAFPSWLSDMGGLPPADPGETMAWEGNLDAGEYVLGCTQSGVTSVPWFGSGLTVVEG